MRIALIFPPQWDPRQPPLGLPTLAGCLAAQQHEVKAWDLNLDFYRTILRRSARRKVNQELIDQYLDSSTLKDPQRFGRLNHSLETLLLSHYDPTGRYQLFWDGLRGPLSPDCSRDWQHACSKPEDLPDYRIIRLHLFEVLDWKPDLVCISMISDTQILSGLAIASRLRKRLKNALIVLGGHAVRVRRSLLTAHQWLFKIADAVCISHGEPTLLALARGAALPDVPNVIWFDGKEVRWPRYLVPSSFVSHGPPDFSILPLDKYLTPSLVMPLETARGCPWGRCSFCGHPGRELPGKAFYFPRPLDMVMQDIREYLKQGWNRIFFVDEALPYHRFRSLAKGISDLPLELNWICYLRLEKQHNLETFRLARKAGCRKVAFGLETGSSRLLRLHRKGFQPRTAAGVIRDASTAALTIHLFLISGFPDESERDQQQTEELLEQILPFVDPFGFTYDIFPLGIELETPLFMDPRSFGLTSSVQHALTDMSSLHILSPSVWDTLSRATLRIGQLVDKHLGTRPGLRHFHISQDSLHLPLLLNAPPSEKRL